MLQKLQQIRENKKPGEGFTIIEVMIVLAIAGLILVVVLIAVPQLQASQRDSARRDTVNRVSAEIQNYSANNNGRTPFGDIDSFQERYLGGTEDDDGNVSNVIVDISNPGSGERYDLQVQTAAADPSDSSNQMFIFPGATCDGESVTGVSGTATSSRVYAIQVELDRDGTFYCTDNR
jgi:prepilin-type N-terminal cleavage/methylation domain-containing protein